MIHFIQDDLNINYFLFEIWESIRKYIHIKTNSVILFHIYLY